MEHFLNLMVRAIFLENMALAYFLGMCSYLACSKKMETAIRPRPRRGLRPDADGALEQHPDAQPARRGGARLAQPSFADVDLRFLSFILFIAVIAAAVQIVEMTIDRFRRRSTPPWASFCR
jgi:Na+-transporting NADH:ubiquinone oxidoreductase subunit E